MLLAVDIGNTNVVLGVFKGNRLIRDWRLHTDLNTTADELFVSLSGLLASQELAVPEIHAVAISCVAPSLLYAWEAFCRQYLRTKPLVVGPDTPTGMTVRIDRPEELGADRIVNAVAAFAKYPRGLIVVDFGTATTFDYVSGEGEYMGGVIAPGILISCEALFAKAAKLPRSALFVRPKSVIGRNTVAGMNSGVVYGFAGMVDGIISRMKRELQIPVKVIATGGLAPLIVSESRTVKVIEPHLTLEGLRLIHERLG